MSKVTRELEKQAVKAEVAARGAPDELAARQQKTLAAAFRAQAKIIKQNKKKKSDPAGSTESN